MSFIKLISKDFLSKRYTVKELIFYTILLLHCLIGGTAAFIGIPFQPYYTSAIVLCFIFIYKIKIDLIFKFHLVFALLIIFSGIINNSSLAGILVGLRLPVISFSMYLIVENYFRQKRGWIEEIVKAIAFIQFPVVLSQLIFSDLWVSLNAISVAPVDTRYGTFYVEGDPFMSLFLTLLVIFLLFRKKQKSNWDIVVLVSSALTVFLASTKVIQLVLLLVLCYYLFVQSNFKQKIYSLGIISALILILTISGYHQVFLNQFNSLYNQMVLKDESEQIEKFLEGNYARMGAILYFLNEPLKLIGDGPGTYTNPLQNEMELGLTGSNFKIYAEYGIAGLIYSIFGIFLIVFAKLRKGFYRYLIVLAVLGLSMTVDVYNSASLIFIFYLWIYITKNESFRNRRVFLFSNGGDMKKIKMSINTS